jgi:hypothetical protein
MVQIQGCGGDEAPRIWEEVDWGAAVGRGKGGETEVEWDVVVELPKLGLRHWQRAQLARPPAGEHGKFALWGPIQVLGGSSQRSLHWSGPCCYGPTWEELLGTAHRGCAAHASPRPTTRLCTVRAPWIYCNCRSLNKRPSGVRGRARQRGMRWLLAPPLAAITQATTGSEGGGGRSQRGGIWR